MEEEVWTEDLQGTNKRVYVAKHCLLLFIPEVRVGDQLVQFVGRRAKVCHCLF